MAKDRASAYEPGGRGKRWFKLKAAETVDCVIVAADRGSGRRVGWLSNYHLAVREGDGFADVGKTFKGLTDAAVRRDDRAPARARRRATTATPCACARRWWWRSTYNEIQRSPTIPRASRCASRASRGVRDDKGPGQATTLERAARRSTSVSSPPRAAPRTSSVESRLVTPRVSTGIPEARRDARWWPAARHAHRRLRRHRHRQDAPRPHVRRSRPRRRRRARRASST